LGAEEEEGRGEKVKRRKGAGERGGGKVRGKGGEEAGGVRGGGGGGAPGLEAFDGGEEVGGLGFGGEVFGEVFEVVHVFFATNFTNFSNCFGSLGFAVASRQM
jgi:hypothetical protein